VQSWHLRIYHHFIAHFGPFLLPLTSKRYQHYKEPIFCIYYTVNPKYLQIATLLRKFTISSWAIQQPWFLEEGTLMLVIKIFFLFWNFPWHFRKIRERFYNIIRETTLLFQSFVAYSYTIKEVRCGFTMGIALKYFIISNVPWSRNYLTNRVLLSILTRLIMENLLHDISSQSPIYSYFRDGSSFQMVKALQISEIT